MELLAQIRELEAGEVAAGQGGQGGQGGRSERGDHRYGGYGGARAAAAAAAAAAGQDPSRYALEEGAGPGGGLDHLSDEEVASM
eukprot:COSAG01_NODE_5651_length_4117_cov_1.371173_2_plen_84_part_00